MQNFSTKLNLGKFIDFLRSSINLSDSDFIISAYQTFLKRTPDSAGMLHYRKKLRAGDFRWTVLWGISKSKEAKSRGTRWFHFDKSIMYVVGFILNILEFSMRFFSKRNDRSNDALTVSNELANRELFDGFKKEIKLELSWYYKKSSLNQQVVYSALSISKYNHIGLDCWQIAENLMSLNENDFVAALFQTGLGRSPKNHEFSHYSHLLSSKVSRSYLIELLFGSDECKIYFNPTGKIVDKGHPRLLKIDANWENVKEVTPPIHDEISFDEPSEPQVTVVIPVYGKVDYTLMCLRSIQNNLPTIAFEIIVVDDRSPDNTVEEMSKISGIRLVQNTVNLGFIRSCNKGASLAKGQYVCFLNNDTEVKPGWLDELVKTFHSFPGTGLVGSKLVYPNGSLQEAGGIIWQDGSAWNFGRNQDPQLPVFNYAREVDYCSGASIVMPLQLFNELGGFDEHYIPAYCEDSDIALKVRAGGHRVIYQPLSVVVHYEGITSGTDTSQGVKSYQIENSKKLFARWKDHLMTHQPNGVDADNAKDRMAKRRVLVLDHCTPTPDQDAGSVTVFNMLLLLREMDFQVTFIAEDNFLYMPEYTTKLQRIGVEVLYAPYVTSVKQHLIDTANRYDLVFLFRPMVVEKHLDTVKKYAPKAKTLFHTVDLHFLRMEREAGLLKDPAKIKLARKMKQIEYDAIRSVDASIVHSAAELEILRPDFKTEKIFAFPLILNIPGTEIPYEKRRNIVFVGGYQHVPNVDAVLYFVKEILPLLKEKIPDVKFYAVGSNPPEEILNLASPDVEITGYVEDLTSLLNKMRISVAPLRYGAGIKGKIGTALAAGLPSVATRIAAEGMLLSVDENILLADQPSEFCEQIFRLYNDPDLWSKLSTSGIAFARSSWGDVAAYSILMDILMQLNLDVTKKTARINMYDSTFN
jgi:GT2 family glycosyltransferase